MLYYEKYFINKAYCETFSFCDSLKYRPSTSIEFHWFWSKTSFFLLCNKDIWWNVLFFVSFHFFLFLNCDKMANYIIFRFLTFMLKYDQNGLIGWKINSHCAGYYNFACFLWNILLFLATTGPPFYWSMQLLTFEQTLQWRKTTCINFNRESTIREAVGIDVKHTKIYLFIE